MKRVGHRALAWQLEHFRHMIWQRQIRNLALEAGAPPPPFVGIDQTESGQSFICYDCGKILAIRGAWRHHRTTEHGQRDDDRHIRGTTCQNCGKGFHTRAAFLRHVKYRSPRCLEHCRATVPPMDDEELAAADADMAEDTKQLKRRGY